MHCVNCPSLDANCAAHREFIVRLQSWFAQFEEGKLPVSALKELHEESCRWIRSHIEPTDGVLRQYPPQRTEAARLG